MYTILVHVPWVVCNCSYFHVRRLLVFSVFLWRQQRLLDETSIIPFALKPTIALGTAPVTHDVPQFFKIIQNGTIRKLGCGFLFAFHSNYGSVLHQFRDKARYWSQIGIFSYPLAFGAPVRVSPSQYCHPVWCEKTRMVGLPDGGKTRGYV